MADRDCRTGASQIRDGQSNGMASPSLALKLDWDPMVRVTRESIKVHLKWATKLDGKLEKWKTGTGLGLGRGLGWQTGTTRRGPVKLGLPGLMGWPAPVRPLNLTGTPCLGLRVSYRFAVSPCLRVEGHGSTLAGGPGAVSDSPPEGRQP